MRKDLLKIKKVIEINKWLDENINRDFTLTEFHINDDFSIDANGPVYLIKSDLKRLPYKFRRVSEFHSRLPYLQTVENFPDSAYLCTVYGNPPFKKPDWFSGAWFSKDVKS